MDARTSPVTAKRWRMAFNEQSKAEALFRELRIHPALCQVLVQRGIESFDAARAFFRPELGQLHSPWLMKDMDKAVDRVLTAFNREEKILVFGDYDVDGTTSVACMYHFLSRHGR